MPLPSGTPWWMWGTLLLIWFQWRNWYCNFTHCVPFRNMFEHLKPTTMLLINKGKGSNYNVRALKWDAWIQSLSSSSPTHISCLHLSVTPFTELGEKNVSVFAECSISLQKGHGDLGCGSSWHSKGRNEGSKPAEIRWLLRQAKLASESAKNMLVLQFCINWRKGFP